MAENVSVEAVPMRRARGGRVAMLLAGVVLSIGAMARGETVRVGIHVTQALNGHEVGGAQVQLVCPPAHVDDSSRTDREGWAHFEFAYEVTHADPPAAGHVAILPLPRPNPVQGVGTVPYLGGVGKAGADAELTLFDLRGRVVARGRLGTGDLVLPGNGAPAGVYLLRCRDGQSGAVSSCRVTAAGGPLLRLRFSIASAEGPRRDPPETFPSTITLRYPGARDRTVDVDLLPGDQDLELTLESLAGQWPAETWLFASDHGWNAAAVDSGWVPAIADTALVFNHRVIDTDGTRHALAVWSGAEPTREYCADILTGRATSALTYVPPVAPVIYFDFSGIPAGATIESAWLILSPVSWSRIPCAPGAAHAATLDIWPADAAWLNAPNSVSCGGVPGSEHYRRTSWQYADVSQETPWSPAMSQRQTWDEFGIHSVKVTHEVRGGHACRYDVTRAIQTWSDNREVMANAGFVLSNWSPYTYFYIAAGPSPTNANRQPLLVVTLSERPRRLPWNGHALAFSFGTDDGDSANARYMEVCEDHGVHMTAFVMRQGVREFYHDSLQKLSIAQWRDFAARGHEVGHHSDHHTGTWGLAEITWGQTDSMNVELARDTWIEDVFQDDGQTASTMDVLAYPAGGVSLWAIKNLVNHDFIMGRCAGGTEFWGLPLWGNSGWTTYLSWYDPVNLYNVAVTDHAWLVGQKNEDVNLDDVRLKLHRVTADMLNQGQSALLTFCHSTKSSTYPRGMDYDELDMLLTAVEETGFYWIGTHGELARYYRDAHVPIAPGDGIGHAAYDSLLNLGHQEFANVWWVLPDHVRRR